MPLHTQTRISRSRWRRRAVGVLATLALALAAAAPASAQDSKGTDFWLGFPGNLGAQELKLFIAGDTATSGTVAIPGLAFSQPFTVTPGAVTTVDLPLAAQMQLSGVVENLGIHVTAADEVTVYGLNRVQFTTDAYLGLPTDALGSDHLVLGYSGAAGSQLAVVGTQDSTAVTITPAGTVSPFTINLNQGQTYMLQATELSGSVITSDKPVSVYGGNRCANVPETAFFCDHIVEQLPATSAWGQSFVSMPLATRLNGDTFRILAAEDDTVVTLNGAAIATLDRGEFHERIIDGPAHITSDKPLLVMQYSNGTTFDNVTSDPFQMMIPPFEQYLGSYTISTPATGFQANFVNVVAPNAAVGTVELDGTAIPASEFTAIGSSGFSGAQVDVALGSHTLSGPLPFGVHSYGFDSFDSYGYPGGLSLSEVARVETLTLSPGTATNAVGEEHCVDALVADQNGNPLQDIRVDFSVSGANSASGFEFTGANGVATFCYTGANAGDDTITASVGTLSDTAAKHWEDSTPVDTDKPSCALLRTGTDAQGRKFLEVRTEDDGSGLASIVVTKSTNADTVVPPFTPGTNDPVIVRATKILSSKSSVVELRVTDVAGNVTVCDPVMTIVARGAGKPVTQTFTDIPRVEHWVRVTNGEPGIQTLEVEVNDRSFKELKLQPGEERTLDVASAMNDGMNRFELTAVGKPGGEALVLITD